MAVGEFGKLLSASLNFEPSFVDRPGSIGIRPRSVPDRSLALRTILRGMTLRVLDS